MKLNVYFLIIFSFLVFSQQELSIEEMKQLEELSLEEMKQLEQILGEKSSVS